MVADHQGGGNQGGVIRWGTPAAHRLGATAYSGHIEPPVRVMAATSEAMTLVGRWFNIIGTR
jgi:hypothetical protein